MPASSWLIPDSRSLAPKTIAIIQPHYLPWLGYFDMIDQVDTFVFLDTVQFVRRSWQHRNRIKTSQGWCWLTVPVSTSEGSRPTIREAEIRSEKDWMDQHVRSIEFAYRRCLHWEDLASILDEMRAIRSETHHLSDLTIRLTLSLAGWLGIEARFVRASELALPRSERAGYLAEICGILDARVYLSPFGSLSYLQGDDSFQRRGIDVVFHHYRHPEYVQRFGTFMSHLTVLDLMANAGPRSIEIIRSGRNPSLRIDEAVRHADDRFMPEEVQHAF